MTDTITTLASVLNSLRDGQVNSAITPQVIRNAVVSGPGIAATSLSAGVASGRYYTGSSPTGTASLPMQAGIAQLSYFTVPTATTFTKSGIETMPDLATAHRTADFVRSVGINVHISQGTAGYTNAANMIADLGRLGISLVRDADTSNNTFNTVAGTLGAAGIRFAYGTNASTISNTNFISNVKAAITAGVQVGNIVSMEGPNEPNNTNYTYQGLGSNTTWQGIAMAVENLYSLIKRDPVLCNVPVASTTDVGEMIDNTGVQFTVVPTGSQGIGRANSAYAMGVVPTVSVEASPFPYRTVAPDGTIFADILNSHIYPLTNAYWDPTFGDQLMGQFFFNFGKISSGHFWGFSFDQLINTPKMITETGYRTDSASGTGNYVDQATQGKNLINGSIVSFIEGIKYFIIYALYDTVGTDAYGLYSAFNTPKLAVTYFGNLMTILADAGGNATTFNAGTPGMIGLTNAPATTWWGMFQKTDGSYWIALTSQLTNWNYATNTTVSVPGSTVTVTFPSTYGTVKVFDPTVSTAAQATTTTVSNAVVTLKDYPLLIQLVPNSASTNIQWAIYATANGVPTGAPVFTSANHLVPNARDVIEETGLSLTLQPGTYAAAVVTDGGATIKGINDASLPGITGQITSRAIGGKSTFTTTLNSGTPASTWPSNPSITETASNVAFTGALQPMVWVRL